MTGDTLKPEKPVDLRTSETRAEVRLALVSLLQSEAWAYVRSMLTLEQARCVDALATSESPNALLRNSGELAMLRKLERWPKIIITTIDGATAAELKKAEEPKNKQERRDARER